jgi:uncharacterized protein YhaN
LVEIIAAAVLFYLYRKADCGKNMKVKNPLRQIAIARHTALSNACPLVPHSKDLMGELADDPKSLCQQLLCLNATPDQILEECNDVAEQCRGSGDVGTSLQNLLRDIYQTVEDCMRQLKEERAQHREDMEKVHAQHREDIEKERAQHTEEMEKERAHHKEEMEKVHAQHRGDIEKERSQHTEEMENVHAQHREEMEKERTQHIEEMEKERAHHKEEMDKERAQHREETEKERAQHMEALQGVQQQMFQMMAFFRNSMHPQGTQIEGSSVQRQLLEIKPAADEAATNRGV